ncbi:MAG: amidohydrolase family protein [Pseudomonadota bacterium]|nr:amidohydrolase family protein [Pseudomonadota bacterium]
MSGIAAAATIDLHAHAVLPATFGLAGRYGPDLYRNSAGQQCFRVAKYTMVGARYEGSPFTDPDERIRQMDAAKIDYQVIGPNPLAYFHFVETNIAVDYCRAHNDVMRDIVAPRSARLGGLAMLPMQSVEAAREELARSVGDLGLQGVQIGTDFPMMLDDPALDVLYEDLVRLNVPLFIHPGNAGIDGPEGDFRLGRFDLGTTIGYAAQETIAVATLVFGGVLDRHPDLKVWVSHGGGMLGFMAGRLSLASRKRPWASDALKQDGGFEERVAKIWFDNHVHSADALSLLTNMVGTDRIVHGTNFAGWDQPNYDEVPAPPAYTADNARRLMGIAG